MEVLALFDRVQHRRPTTTRRQCNNQRDSLRRRTGDFLSSFWCVFNCLSAPMVQHRSMKPKTTAVYDACICNK